MAGLISRKLAVEIHRRSIACTTSRQRSWPGSSRRSTASFGDEINTMAGQRSGESDSIDIIDFEPRYAGDFKRLNVEWLEKYFAVEPIDEHVLSDPSGSIIEPGGAILLALAGDEIVGTCALIKAGDLRYELSKMAVTERFQGRRIGRQLLVATITRFHELGGQELFLESNSVLTPALTLYESAGFVHAPRPGGASHYARGNVYMVYRPGPQKTTDA